MPTAPQQRPRHEEQGRARLRCAETLDRGEPIAGTLAAGYLGRRRKLDLAAPADGCRRTLRFHPHCPSARARGIPACLRCAPRRPTTPPGFTVSLWRRTRQQVDRRMLGRSGVVKLWPARIDARRRRGRRDPLSAATRVPYRGSLAAAERGRRYRGMRWSFPAGLGFRRLILLVDRDENLRRPGRRHAVHGALAPRRPTVIRLTPKRPGPISTTSSKGAHHE